VKPYLYILAVLLVGGGIGYYVGEKSVTYEQSHLTLSGAGSNDSEAIQKVLKRQGEAYTLHDALLLLRDCSPSYVEINGNSGESYNLERSLISHHELFTAGKSVNFNVINPEIQISKNLAVIKASYSKTSDSYEKEGIKGLVGNGLWILSKTNGRWQIDAFAWTEDVK
jgi:hypothetical protein